MINEDIFVDGETVATGKVPTAQPEYESDQTAASGTMPEPGERNPDAGKIAQEVGLYPEESQDDVLAEDIPEVSVADQVKRAERERRGIG